jgi:predicted MFS family arabinose efflux permease
MTLCTEIVPGARATMMSVYFAAAGLGRVTGALAGGPVWLAGGMLATGFFSAVAGILALASLAYGLKR